MAEPSRYVSLRDLLEKEPPNHRFTYHSESTATDDEDDDYEEHFSLRSVMRKPPSLPQPKSSDVPGQVSRANPLVCKDKRKNKIVEKVRKGLTDVEASKSITRSARFSSLRHSRSDDPLVYVGCRGEDFDAFDLAEDLKTASRRLLNFSWEEMNLKSNVASDSDDNC